MFFTHVQNPAQWAEMVLERVSLTEVFGSKLRGDFIACKCSFLSAASGILVRALQC